MSLSWIGRSLENKVLAGFILLRFAGRSVLLSLSCSDGRESTFLRAIDAGLEFPSTQGGRSIR